MDKSILIGSVSNSSKNNSQNYKKKVLTEICYIKKFFHTHSNYMNFVSEALIGL